MPKILIADDDPAIRDLLKETLEEFEDKGVEILSAVNGKEAVEIIKTNNPELVILDIAMPEMDGIEACHVTKNLLNLKNIYILILTAKSQKHNIQTAEKAGADSYMIKPFDPDQLCKKVSIVLEINN